MLIPSAYVGQYMSGDGTVMVSPDLDLKSCPKLLFCCSSAGWWLDRATGSILLR